tara:strand:+ start:266 stop:895 length:630 start_codon:yes stop_codon:yes gene_type:complete
MSIKNFEIDLNEIERKTISHYEENAEPFWIGTKDHDVSQNIDAFLNALPKDKTLDILELGCGPGRDLCVFRSKGHIATGLDGCEQFCRMALENSGCEVLNQSFLNLDLKKKCYDGIFANASLFHVPRIELPRVLKELHGALRKNGILFSSNPRGDYEGWNGKRYVNYMEFETSQHYLNNSGFKVLDYYYRPQGKPKKDQPWLAIVSQIK